MQSYCLFLPVESIRNTGTFFEGLALKVVYDRVKQEVYVTFSDGTQLIFVERETFTQRTGIGWKDPKDYAGCIGLRMQDEDNLRNLLHIAMLSGGEILREPFYDEEGNLCAYMEDYNGYRYEMVYPAQVDE